MIARRSRAEAWRLSRAASVLPTLPRTREAFAAGTLSWSQVSAIAGTAGSLDGSSRQALDAFVGARAPREVSADPEALVSEVWERAERRAQARVRAREARAQDRRALWFYPRLDGGADLRGRGDAEGIATILEALERAAPRPERRGPFEPSTRPRQLFDALVGVCEDALSGRCAAPGSGAAAAATGARARPRLYATFDLDRAAADPKGSGAALLTRLRGGPVRLSALGTERLVCDADLVPVAFREGMPVAVGEPGAPITSAVRRAAAARDGGCRFPGCDAPLAHCDLHHIVARSRGGTSGPRDLVSTCRHHHTLIHRHRRAIRWLDGGVLEFRRGPTRLESRPHTTLPPGG